MNNKVFTTTLLIIIIALGAWWLFGTGEATGPSATTTPATTTPANTDTGSVSATTTVPIALLDYPAASGRYTKESDGVERGCDKVVIKRVSVASTTMPLTAALEKLFSYEETAVEGWQNFIARTNDTLSFERASVDGGTASVYLTGEVSGRAGMCDDPRPQIQIEETALAFPNIDTVQLYLNGTQTDLRTPQTEE